jgi:hypothetical protein
VYHGARGRFDVYQGPREAVSPRPQPARGSQPLRTHANETGVTGRTAFVEVTPALTASLLGTALRAKQCAQVPSLGKCPMSLSAVILDVHPVAGYLWSRAFPRLACKRCMTSQKQAVYVLCGFHPRHSGAACRACAAPGSGSDDGAYAGGRQLHTFASPPRYPTS